MGFNDPLMSRIQVRRHPSLCPASAEPGGVGPLVEFGTDFFRNRLGALPAIFSEKRRALWGPVYLEWRSD